MQTEELDPRAILAALGVSDAESIAPVRGGSDTAIWRVERGGEASALRVFRPEQQLACRREIAAMSAARAAGVPVPEVRAAGSWRDRPALLIDWCAGATLLAEIGARPWRAIRLGEAFGRTQAAIHSIRAPRVLLDESDRWIDWAGPDEGPLKARLRALAPRADALLHLDYHPLNVLARGVRIAGVLDWTNALAGDPRADVARTVTILRLAGVMLETPPSRIERLTFRAFELGWHRGYAAAAGAPLADMPAFYAWAGAAMLRDLGPKVGPTRSLDRVARWTAYWKRRAGIV